MNIMITGSFGNIGKYVVNELIKRGHHVRCYDILNRKNRKVSSKFPSKAEIVWGDLRTGYNLDYAVKHQDVIIHMAFIIPPLSEKNPSLAYNVNIIGTENLINSITHCNNKARLIFTSSIATYGNTQNLLPPRRAEDSVNPLDVYGKQKIECEQIIKQSGVKWIILRLAAAPSIDLNRIDPIMFEVPLNDRIEFVHPADVALAISNAVELREISGKTFLIGGGPKCRINQATFMKKALDMLGIGMLSEKAFSSTHYHTDWMDTTESQNILKYQRYSFDDFLKEQAAVFGARVFVMKVMRPLIRLILLLKSPYYFNHYKPEKQKWNGRVAMITGASSGIGTATAKRLAAEGIRVIMTARRKNKLQRIKREIELTGGKAHIITADLSNKNNRVYLFEKAHSIYGRIDILINNAGFGWYGYYYDMDWYIPAEKLAVKAEVVAEKILKMIKNRRKFCYVPSFLKITPFLEFCFGWLINLLGPLLLKKSIKYH